MNARTFDSLATSLVSPEARRAVRDPAGHPSRRALLTMLAAPLVGILPVGAKKKKKRGKKSTLCLDGQTVQASKKKKKSLLKRGATPGACPPGCTPTCAGNACGGDDGCGGICGCAAGSLCYSGVCNPCTVRCTGDGAACGNALQPFLNGGGTVVACPGRYVGNFTLPSNGSLIGAGDGDDPATNTILDGNGSGHVVRVNAGVTTALIGLRITGGNVPADLGGGIRTEGSLTLTACAVHRNVANFGGGIFRVSTATGPLTLNDCVVSENKAADSGGGIYNVTGTTTIYGSALIGNEADYGGGLYNDGTVIFDSASSVTGNTATVLGGTAGIYNKAGASVTLNGATVSGNNPTNCVNVPTCIG